MKKFFTLKNILLLGAAFFGLLAFFLSFGASMKVTMEGTRGELRHIIWGCDAAVYDGHVEAIPYKIGPSVLPMVGLILILVGILAAVVVGLFLNKPFAKWIVVGCAVVALAGSIMAFIVIGPFARAYVDAMIKAMGIQPTQAQYDQALAEVKTMFKNGDPVTVIPVLSGIFGIIAAGAAGVSQFLPEKK